MQLMTKLNPNEMNHPLTDKIIENISSFYLSDMGETGEGIRQDMRSAADWQLEQVIEFVAKEDTVYAEYIYKAMRPQQQ